MAVMTSKNPKLDTNAAANRVMEFGGGGKGGKKGKKGGKGKAQTKRRQKR